MDDPLCRVSIQCVGSQTVNESRVVDLALPRHAQVGQLLPDIVDLVIGTQPPPDTTVQGWRLDRLCGGRCDESISLHENGIDDGDVMVLSAFTAPAPGPLHDDLFRTVSAVTERSEVRSALPAGAWAGVGAIAVIALGYSGTVGGAAVVAAVAALVSAGACIMTARRLTDSAMQLTLQAVSVGFACISGFLAVPEAAGLPNIVLGAAAGCAASVWMLRSGVGDASFFTAAATTFALLAAVGAASVAVSAALSAVGATLGVLALGALSAAGRAAMLLTGLRPAFPGRPDAPIVRPDSEDLAIMGHTAFAGLVTGSAAAAALAVGMIAVGCLGGGAPWPRGVALIAAISALLLLRTRFYADPRCRAAAGWCGLIGAGAAVALATVSAPRYAGAAVALTVGLMGWCQAARRRPLTATPVWARTIDILEYVLLAAVVPLACWVAGLYELVRSLSLG